MAPFGRLVKAWQRGGARLAARVALDCGADAVLERWLGIRGAGPGAGSPGRFPVSIRAFHAVLRDLDVREHDVFVDYGCGTGRALVLAAHFPFRELVGFDVSGRLIAVAHGNLLNALPDARRRDVLVLHCDARAFRLPDTATVLHLGDRFEGELAASVFADLERSLRARPRRVRLVFNDPARFRDAGARYPWLAHERDYGFEPPVAVYSADPAALAAAA
jgi:SAM-dependent methyltransferase